MSQVGRICGTALVPVMRAVPTRRTAKTNFMLLLQTVRDCRLIQTGDDGSHDICILDLKYGLGRTCQEIYQLLCEIC